MQFARNIQISEMSEQLFLLNRTVMAHKVSSLKVEYIRLKNENTSRGCLCYLFYSYYLRFLRLAFLRFVLKFLQIAKYCSLLSNSIILFAEK